MFQPGKSREVEPSARTGEGDVEYPFVFLLLFLLNLLLGSPEQVDDHGFLIIVIAVEPIGMRACEPTTNKHHRKFQPLRCVNGHHLHGVLFAVPPQGVVVAGFSGRIDAALQVLDEFREVEVLGKSILDQMLNQMQAVGRFPFGKIMEQIPLHDLREFQQCAEEAAVTALLSQFLPLHELPT